VTHLGEQGRERCSSHRVDRASPVFAVEQSCRRCGKGCAFDDGVGSEAFQIVVLERPPGVRGVNLLGIDSVMSPQEERQEAWYRLAQELPLDKLGAMTSHACMADLPELGRQILQGKLRGRIVVDINA
jgi:hypothetical protein